MLANQSSSKTKMRVDKWLWAARFFKTRTLAKEAVNSGKVRLGGRRVKASQTVSKGDALSIRQGWDEREIIVQALNDQRRPAKEARMLFCETETSLAKQSSAEEIRKADASPSPAKRPDKVHRKALRQLHKQFTTP